MGSSRQDVQQMDDKQDGLSSSVYENARASCTSGWLQQVSQELLVEACSRTHSGVENAHTAKQLQGVFVQAGTLSGQCGADDTHRISRPPSSRNKSARQSTHQDSFITGACWDSTLILVGIGVQFVPVSCTCNVVLLPRWVRVDTVVTMLKETFWSIKTDLHAHLECNTILLPVVRF